jgi:hypothetical protein
MPEIPEDSAQNRENIKETSPNEVLQAPELRLLLQDLRLSRLEGAPGSMATAGHRNR